MLVFRRHSAACSKLCQQHTTSKLWNLADRCIFQLDTKRTCLEFLRTCPNHSLSKLNFLRGSIHRWHSRDICQLCRQGHDIFLPRKTCTLFDFFDRCTHRECMGGSFLVHSKVGTLLPDKLCSWWRLCRCQHEILPPSTACMVSLLLQHRMLDKMRFLLMIFYQCHNDGRTFAS